MKKEKADIRKILFTKKISSITDTKSASQVIMEGQFSNEQSSGHDFTQQCFEELPFFLT